MIGKVPCEHLCARITSDGFLARCHAGVSSKSARSHEALATVK